MELFSSRDSRYRAPFGAVEEKTEILFRICLPRSLACHGAFFVCRTDSGMDRQDGMFWAGMEGSDHEWWDCRFTPDTADLYWYAFRLQTDAGDRWLSCRDDKTAALCEQEGDRWQLTCYEQGFTTPDWLSGGVIYQIFPDRFAASHTEKKNVPDDRILRDDWGGEPAWRPDEKGVVRNNDFFGGDLDGIREKLPYLSSLGVTCLYLNPIFESHSNHRYDTADYTHIDPLLGDEAAFSSLAKEAKKNGIRLMLDGVFSHTGADSVYFNKNGRYESLGAYQSPESPYYPWYSFEKWPDRYHGWWGFETLPEVNELNGQFLSYITGEDGIVRRWLKAGASAWRLDVADELPDGFLDALRAAAKAEKPDAVVLGEVWEDASNKSSYGHRRRYLLGKQLDSVMNYPFREAILTFVRGGDGTAFFNKILNVVENYPPQVLRLLMNSLGTHDTERAMTALAGEDASGRGRNWQSAQHLSEQQYQNGVCLLKLAAAIQYCLPGVPCLYYGDEAGMSGYRDPFNRGCYPWGNENADLIDWFGKLGALRKEQAAFCEGEFVPLFADADTVIFARKSEKGGGVICAVNRGEAESIYPLPEEWANATVKAGDAEVKQGLLHIPSHTPAILFVE